MLISPLNIPKKIRFICLIAILLLASLVVVGGVACGGDEEDDRTSRSSRSSEDRESSSSSRSSDSDEDADEDEEEEEEGEDKDKDDGDSQSSARGILGGSGSSGSGGASGSSDSSGSSSPSWSGPGVSADVLATLPNLVYDWILLIDTATYKSGDIPKEVVAAGLDSYNSVEDAFSDLFSLGTGTAANSAADAGAIIIFETDSGNAHAIQGWYEGDAVRNFYDANESLEPIEGTGTNYEAWGIQGGGPVTALLNDQVYWLWDAERSLEFLEPLDQGNTLISDPANPMARAMEKAGSGWLVAGLDGPNHCDEFNFEFDSETCQAVAFAAVQGSTPEFPVTLEINWVILLDSEGNANLLKQAFEEHLKSWERISSSIGRGSILSVDADGEFVVIHAWATPAGAAYFMDKSGLY